MKTNLAILIKSAIAAEITCQYQEEGLGAVTIQTQEAAQLALNALEERLAEMIETKITQMLSEGVTRP